MIYVISFDFIRWNFDWISVAIRQSKLDFLISEHISADVLSFFSVDCSFCCHFKSHWPSATYISPIASTHVDSGCHSRGSRDIGHVDRRWHVNSPMVETLLYRLCDTFDPCVGVWRNFSGGKARKLRERGSFVAGERNVPSARTTTLNRERFN